MSASEYLGTYAEGRTKGDAGLILKAAADNYTLDDPNSGVIPKNEFADYLEGMKETVTSLRKGTLTEPFMEIYDTSKLYLSKHDISNYYNVVLFGKILTMMINSSKYREKLSTNHLLLP